MWNKVKTFEDPIWTKKYHETDPKKSFGGKVVIKLKNGTIIEEEKSVADAHPNGLRPFRRANYIQKFKTLTDGIVTVSDSKKFLKNIQNLKKFKS